MPINWSTTAISAAYFGLNPVTKAYFGTTQVYPNVDLSCIACADYLPLGYINNYSAPFNPDYILGRSFDYIDYSVRAEPTFTTNVDGIIYPDGTTTGDFIKSAERNSFARAYEPIVCANIMLTPAGAELLDRAAVIANPVANLVDVDDGRVILVGTLPNGEASPNANFPSCFVFEFFRFSYRRFAGEEAIEIFPDENWHDEVAVACRALKINCDPVNNPDGPWSTINVTSEVIDGILLSTCNGELDGGGSSFTAEYIDQLPKISPTIVPGDWGYVISNPGISFQSDQSSASGAPTPAEFRANIVPKLLEVYSPTTLYFPNGLEL